MRWIHDERFFKPYTPEQWKRYWRGSKPILRRSESQDEYTLEKEAGSREKSITVNEKSI